ncbi:hypothetical protein [Actinomadura montaniterrae]|uniref:hypothetical protein n=1 Tax=Actinomadura montaniterrae TaxID=1803903 RepID=UPI00178C6431|nr:hypothetical protein [Actinomadura montaniterrae]
MDVHTRTDAHTRVVAGGCLVAAPAVQGLSTFFWNGGDQGIAAGALVVVATVFWVTGLAALFRLVERRAPRYAAFAFPLAVYGCVGGAAFGVQGLCEELFGVPHDTAVDLLRDHQAAAQAAFWLAGPLFPISVFVLGAVLMRLRAVPLPAAALMSVGAVLFPLSRIPREAVVAHLADLLLLLPFAHLGVLMAMGRLAPPKAADAAGGPAPVEAVR